MTALQRIQSKLFFQNELGDKLIIWRAEGKKIVFTNGCFDILHLGHVDYLSKAADLGDILIVGVNADSSVSKLKGNHRPINNELSRSTLIASLNFVDAVIVFSESTPYELIKFVQPDVLVKGSDYLPQAIVGYDIVTAKGGKIMTIDLLEGYSTSLIENKIITSQQQ